MLDPRTLLSFEEELEKQALPSMTAIRGAVGGAARTGLDVARQRVGAVGSGVGVGALGGAALGAAGGGLQGYHQAKQEGADGLQAVARGLGGAVNAGLKGGLIGAGVGGALGASGAISPALGKDLAGRSDLLGRSARFGQRQVHGLTGAVPAGSANKIEAIRAMGGGAAPAKARMEAAHAAKQGKSGKEYARALSNFEEAEKGFGAAEKAEGLGLTSLPGYAKSLVTRPVETTRAALQEQWYGGGPMHRLMTLGLPAAGAGAALLAPESNDPNRPGKAEQALGALAPVAAVGTLPLSGMIGAGVLTSKALQTAGAGIDALRHRKPEPAQ